MGCGSRGSRVQAVARAGRRDSDLRRGVTALATRVGRLSIKRTADPGVVMAQRTQVTLIDDLDGGAATGSVTFALDGQTYPRFSSSTSRGVSTARCIRNWRGSRPEFRR